MENKAVGTGEVVLSPEDAKAALLTVSDLAASTEWSPRRWAAVVAGLAFASEVAVAAWGRFWWFFVGLALFSALVVLLRRQLFNPRVRVRPWQHLDKQGGGGAWVSAFWPMWIPVTMFVSDWPMWTGLVVGVLAGFHTYWAMRQFGERR